MYVLGKQKQKFDHRDFRSMQLIFIVIHQDKEPLCQTWAIHKSSNEDKRTKMKQKLKITDTDAILHVTILLMTNKLIYLFFSKHI